MYPIASTILVLQKDRHIIFLFFSLDIGRPIIFYSSLMSIVDEHFARNFV